MPPLPKVALLIETSNAYARGLLSGIQAFIRENKPWSIYLAEQGRGDQPPPWLKKWKGDGVIARIENPSIAKAVAALQIPAVDMSAGRLLPQLPCCEIDEAGIARMAVDHFLERGFKHFAWCGDPRFVWSGMRGNAYISAVAAAGYPVHEYAPPPHAGQDEDAEMDAIGQWLKGLPRPVAVFACYDIRGRLVLDACRRHNIFVPDEAAVLAVDNDELLCTLAYPPLSSIIPNAMRTGYEAASLLSRMMAGEKVPAAATLTAPTGLVTRQSTDVLAVEDQNVARAVRFIREHACDGICVDDVVRDAGLSRRLLEGRFKTHLSRSPHEEITRVQILRVKELLALTDLPLAEVADRTGFRYVEYLSAVFKNKVGVPPGHFRNEHRPKKKK
ncbi:MAG TPA: DNA-binding transcriptional regulator [Verrucomicrobiales bacterium]|jgi:LacI family transcriptional regulator|nr:DNA-binding transcriptional regulator [Verrucomicrobiales bacterium]